MKNTVGRLTLYLLIPAITFLIHPIHSAGAQGRAPDLLTEVEESERARLTDQVSKDLAARNPQSGVLRSRVVRLNVDLIKSLSERTGQNVIRFNLFENENDRVIYEGVIQRPPFRESAGQTLLAGILRPPAEAGRAEPIPGTGFTVVSENNLVAANIFAPEGVFQILPISGELYVVEQLDTSAPLQNDAVRRPPKRATSALPGRMRDDGKQVDVLVVYTTQAKNHFGSAQAIEIRADLAAQLTNQAFANSGIDLKVRIVHKQEIPRFIESYDFGYTLDRISDDPEVNRLRNQYNADQVTLIRYGGNMWGIAYMLSALDPSYESLAFSEIDSSHVANYYVFSHELGHNFGCAHNIEDVDVWGLYSYSLGYWFSTPHHGIVGTIMSYQGDRILYYSNPDVLYDEVPTGVTGRRDNARTIRNSKLLVCNYRHTTP